MSEAVNYVGIPTLLFLDRVGLNAYNERAFRLLNDYGPNLTFVEKLLARAADQGEEKLEVVLTQLEAHYEAYLKHQDLVVRGLACDAQGINQTTVELERIETEVLGM